MIEATVRDRIDSAPGNRVRPTLVYFAVFAGAVGLDLLVPLPIGPVSVGAGRWLTASALIAAGLTLLIWSLLVFSRRRTGIMPDQPARQVVTTGPYRWSRNPMFVAFGGIYIGLAWLGNTAWPLLLLPLVVLLVTRTVIACEEDYMRRRFGATYEQYCARVGRWF